MIDVQRVQDFEAGFAALLDALDKLRALSAPKESDGIKGLVKWADEVRKALSIMPELPDADPLTQFAEEVERAVREIEGKGGGAGAFERPHPRDGGILQVEPEFWGEITGVVPYTFKEKKREDATTWSDLAGGRTGTVYEANAVAGIAVGTIIKIRVVYDKTGVLRYVFDVTSAIPPGTADKQMLAWDNTGTAGTPAKAWDLILPDGTWLDVDLTTGKLKHIGPGPHCYGFSTGGGGVCGLSLDAVGQTRWIQIGGTCYGPCV